MWPYAQRPYRRLIQDDDIWTLASMSMGGTFWDRPLMFKLAEGLEKGDVSVFMAALKKKIDDRKGLIERYRAFGPKDQ